MKKLLALSFLLFSKLTTPPTPGQMTKIYSVHELATLLKGTLETRFPFIWVRGQVSNLSRPGSGHIYFTIKDEHSCLDAVWFRQMQRPAEKFNPLTGEVFDDGPHPNLAQTMQNGEEILCAGKISLYPPQGRMQMVVELAQPLGLGFLQQEFERLKQEIFTRGWFALERKRPLPHNPDKVAVVTAPSGAVIHDFLRIAKGRGKGGEIRIYPALVQGVDAPASITGALKQAVSDGWAQVAVLIRGGGSLEDLWAFNSKEVARVIFESPIPVITGIGHEPDVSIADLVADVRAATPTHAAQLIWTERETIAQQIDELELSARHHVKALLNSLEEKTNGSARTLHFFSPEATLERHEEHLENEIQRMNRAAHAIFSNNERALWQQRRGLSPALLHLGFNNMNMQINRLYSQSEALILKTIGRYEAELPPNGHIFSLLNQTLMRYENKLPASSVLNGLLSRSLERAESQMELAETQLEAANPARPLNKGYALVRNARGEIITKSSQAKPGQHIEILLASGSLDAEVKKTKPSSNDAE